MLGLHLHTLENWTIVAWPLVVQLALDATIVLGATVLACLVLHRRSAALRHAIWTVAIVGLLTLPVLRTILPGVPLGRLISMDQIDQPTAEPPVAAQAEPPLTEIFEPETLDPADLNHTELEGPLIANAAHETSPLKECPPKDAQAELTSVSTVEPPPIVPEEQQPSFAAWFAQLMPWPVVLAGLWGVGVLWQLLFFIHAWTSTAWSLRGAQAVDDPRWQTLLAEMCSRLDLRRTVTIVQSDRTTVPSTAGWLRPRIILPPDHGEWSDDIRRVVLAHELTHVARRDVLWQMVARAAGVFYWFHPLVHLASRRLRWERELACDDAVLRLGERPSSYARHLLGFAAALAGRSPLLSAAVAMASRRPIETRIRSVLHPTLSRRPLTFRAGCVLIGVMGLVLLAVGVIRAVDTPEAKDVDVVTMSETDSDATEFEGIADKKDGKTETRALDSEMDPKVVKNTNPSLLLTVLDKKDRPVAGARVKKRVWGVGNRSYKTTRHRCDKNGQLRLDLPKWPVVYCALNIEARGFAPFHARWEPGNVPDPIPESYTVRLDPGRAIGGVVQDEQGKPIAGARVHPFYFFKMRPERNQRLGSGAEVRTDSKGRWSYPYFPANLEQVELTLRHPDYMVTRLTRPTSELTASPDKSFKNVLVMKCGVSIVGKVLDADGHPISGAVVHHHDSTAFHGRMPSVKTNEKGVYRIDHARPIETFLTTSADGWAPALTPVKVERDMMPVDFTLSRGQPLRVRVVDVDNKPLAKAGIVLSKWEGKELLGRMPFGHGRTKTDGTWTWEHAPEGTLEFDIFKKGHAHVDNEQLSVDEKENVVVMRGRETHLLRVSGRVIDAATKKPIARFRVIPGTSDDQWETLRWDNGNRAGYRGGQYRKEFTSSESALRLNKRYRLRIEADGYLPAISRELEIDEGDVKLDFVLEKSSGIAVLTPKGKPAAGATVALCTRSLGPFVKNAEVSRNSPCYWTTTDAEGRFTVAPPDERFALRILHASGTAHVPEEELEDGAPIRLEPWARVEGTIFVDGRPAPDQEVAIDDVGQPARQHGVSGFYHFTTTTNRQGRFVIPKMVPGAAQIMYRPTEDSGKSTGNRREGAFHRMNFPAGKTTRIELGRDDEPVVSVLDVTAVLPDSDDNKISPAVNQNLKNDSATPRLDIFQIDNHTTGKQLAERAPKIAELLTKASLVAYKTGTITTSDLISRLRLARDMKIRAAELTADKKAWWAALENYAEQTDMLIKRIDALNLHGLHGGEKINLILAQFSHEVAKAEAFHFRINRIQKREAWTAAVQLAEQLVPAAQNAYETGTLSLYGLIGALKCRRDAKLALLRTTDEQPSKDATLAILKEYAEQITRLHNRVEALHKEGARGGENVIFYHTAMEDVMAHAAVKRAQDSDTKNRLMETTMLKRCVNKDHEYLATVRLAYEKSNTPLSTVYPALDNVATNRARLAELVGKKNVPPLKSPRMEPMGMRLDLLKRIAALNAAGARGGEVANYTYAAAQYALARLDTINTKKPTGDKQNRTTVRNRGKSLDVPKMTSRQIRRLKQRMAQQFAELLEKRDYQAAMKMCSPELQKVLPPSKLRSMVKDLETRYGTISVDRSNDTRRWGDERLFLVELDMRRAELECRLALDDDGQIIGLWIGRQQSDHPTQDFSESQYQFGRVIKRIAGAKSQIHVHVVGIDGQPVVQSVRSLWMEVPQGSKPRGDIWSWTDPATGRVWQLVASEYDRLTANKLLPGIYRAEVYSRTKAPGRNYALSTPCGISDEIRLDAADSSRDITVHLQKGPSLTLRLLDTATDGPLEKSYAFLKNIDNGFYPGHTYHLASNNGKFTAEHLPPGTYRLYAGRSAQRPEDLQYRPVDEPVTITVVEGQDQERTIPVAGKPLDQQAIDARWPWAATGTVTDEQGRPMEGVEIGAHCGIGSLWRTGLTTTDKAGRYTLRFGSGFIMDSHNGKPPLNAQCVIISPQKDGYVEKNLYRHGSRTAANRLPEKNEITPDVDPEKFVIPGRPAKLDFVMIRAASIEGRLVDEHNRPLAGWTMGLGGKVNPPGGSLTRTSKTDADGRFQLNNVPPGYDWRLGTVSPTSPQNRSSSQPIRFAQGGQYRVTLRHKSANDSKTKMLEMVSRTGPDGKNHTAEVVGDDSAARMPDDSRLQTEGQKILDKMARVNKQWLIDQHRGGGDYMPRYEYDFVAAGQKPRHVDVDYMSRRKVVDASPRQGILWNSALHYLARYGKGVVFDRIEEDDERITLDYHLEKPVKTVAGNCLVGMKGAPAAMPVSKGRLVLDRQTFVPRKHMAGGTREVLSDYILAGSGQYLPRSIDIHRDGNHWRWSFTASTRPWLLRSSHSIDEKGQVKEELARVENVTVEGRPRAARKYGRMVLRAVDIDTGRPLAGVSFGRSNTGCEAWGNAIGVSDSEGYLRFDAVVRGRPPEFDWYYSVWKLPKGYKVAGMEEVKLVPTVNGLVEHVFKLRKRGVPKSPKHGPLTAEEFARVPEPKPQPKNYWFASTVDDMPGFEGKEVKFSFYPTSDKRITREQRELAAEIFRDGRFVAKVVRSELEYFQRAVPKDHGRIDEMDHIVIEIYRLKENQEKPRYWRFECRVPGGVLRQGYLFRFKDVDEADLYVPDYRQ